jgi:hypothetical protein
MLHLGNTDKSTAFTSLPRDGSLAREPNKVEDSRGTRVAFSELMLELAALTHLPHDSRTGGMVNVRL